MVAGIIIFFVFVPLGVAYNNQFYSQYLPMQDVSISPHKKHQPS